MKKITTEEEYEESCKRFYELQLQINKCDENIAKAKQSVIERIFWVFFDKVFTSDDKNNGKK